MDLDFFDEVKRYGGRAFIVGGFLRDKILGLENKDIDIEVFGIQGKELYELLYIYGKVKVVGNFEIYLLNGDTEIYLNKSERIDILESARRRDLTINSLYYDPLDDKMYDFLGGKEDIEDGVLRFCNENSFMDDSIRILRVAYFHGKYGFRVDKNLKKLILNNRDMILEVSNERIFREFEKILFLSDNFEALNFLEEMGILQLIIGKNLNIGKLRYKNRLVLWSLLALGSSDFPYYFVEEKKLINDIGALVKAYNDLKLLEKSYSTYSLKKIAVKVDIKTLCRIYYELYGNIDFIKIVYGDYLRFRKDLSPFLMGKDLINLGLKNNEKFGKILGYLYDKQLQGEFETKEEVINYVKNRYKEFTNFS